MYTLEPVLSGTTLRPSDAAQIGRVEAALPEGTPVALDLTLPPITIPVVQQRVDIRRPLADAINTAWRAGQIAQGQTVLPLWAGDVVPAHVTDTGVQIRWVKGAVWGPVIIGLLGGLSVAGVLAGVVTLPEAALLFLTGLLVYEVVKYWALLKAVFTHPVGIPGVGSVSVGDLVLAGGGLLLLLLLVKRR